MRQNIKSQESNFQNKQNCKKTIFTMQEKDNQCQNLVQVIVNPDINEKQNFSILSGDHATSELLDSQIDQNQQTGESEYLKPSQKRNYQCTVDNNQMFTALKTTVKKGNQDQCYYLVNAFNCEQDNFAAKIITNDSKYIKPESIQKDKMIITALISNCKMLQIKKIYKQMVVHAYFFDQFVEKYFEQMWNPDYQGDDELYDLFVEDVITQSQTFIQNHEHQF
ncbi:hypothetical protein ABPG72_004779 [Tetrahymena utriculariae]